MNSIGFPRQRFAAAVYAARILVVTGAINVIIGLFITVVRGEGLWENIVISAAIGWSICALNIVAVWYRKFQRIPVWMLALTVLVGGLAGILISGLVLDYTLALVMIEQPRVLLTVLAYIVLFGTVVTYFFESRRHMADAAAQLQAEQLRHAQSAQQLAEVQLKLLQA